MLNRFGRAAALCLLLTTGCAANAGSASQALDTGDTPDGSAERCTRTVGDFDHPGVLPPTISIPIGDRDVDAATALDEARANPSDSRAALLAQFVTARLNVDAGADINDRDIDLFVDAEDMLVAIERGDDLSPSQEADLPELVSALEETNQALSLDVPCRRSVDDTLFSSEASAPTGPDRNPISDARRRAQNIPHIFVTSDLSAPAPRVGR